LQYSLFTNQSKLLGNYIYSYQLYISDSQILKTNENVALIVGITVPLGIIIIFLILYRLVSLKDLDLPGSDYIPTP
jgi:hypothetical protein